MNIDPLVKAFRGYAAQSEGVEKRKFNILAAALGDPDFIRLVGSRHMQTLNQINSYMANNQTLEWVKSNQPGILDDLTPLYFECLIYEIDKTRNISYFETKTTELETRIEETQQSIQQISETAKLISGATILSEYAKDFEKGATEHQNKAIVCGRWLSVSIVGFVVIVGLVLFVNIAELPGIKHVIASDLTNSGSIYILLIVIKAAIVFGYLQIPGLLKRNYYAEKHLEEAYTHRKNVLKALHAVYNTLSDPIEKDKIITIGATIAFTEPESGFITTKEGAGDSSITDTLLGRLIK